MYYSVFLGRVQISMPFLSAKSMPVLSARRKYLKSSAWRVMVKVSMVSSSPVGLTDSAHVPDRISPFPCIRSTSKWVGT